MSEQPINPSNKVNKRVEKPFFITYTVACYAQEGPEKEGIILEISPFSLLIAASVVSENLGTDTQKSYATALLNIVTNLSEYYTITAVNYR